MHNIIRLKVNYHNINKYKEVMTIVIFLILIIKKVKLLSL